MTLAPVLVPLTALATMVALVGSAGAETYRIVNKDDRSQFVLAACTQTPSNPTLDWIRRNCTELDPEAAGSGPIADVLYSAAGNSADAANGGFMEIYGWSHEVQSPRDTK